MSVDIDFTCEKPLGRITSYCNSSHEIEFDMRCRKCVPCFHHKKRMWVAKLIDRFDQNCSNVKQVYLWTLGTNWGWSDDNMGRLKRAWVLFRKRVNINQKRRVWRGRWKPLVYVIEEGKAGFLHIHVVVHGRLDQSVGRALWSELTGIEEPNFGYSPPKRRSPIAGMIYLAKYLSKGIYNWYWLGDMRGKIIPRSVFCWERYIDGSKCNDWLYKYYVEVWGLADTYEFHMLPKERGSWQKSLNEFGD